MVLQTQTETNKDTGVNSHINDDTICEKIS